MSKIGNAPILIPDGVTIEKTGNTVVVNGPKGNLPVELLPEVDIEVKDSKVLVSRKNETKKAKSLHGLVRSLIANNIIGVIKGWEKGLELVGVGFRVAGGEDKIVLTVGYSHPVEIKAPEGIRFEIRDNTKIRVSGIDKHLVGQVAANVRMVRPPDAYKGKGVRYEGEQVRKKPGKAGKVGVK